MVGSKLVRSVVGDLVGSWGPRCALNEGIISTLIFIIYNTGPIAIILVVGGHKGCLLLCRNSLQLFPVS